MNDQLEEQLTFLKQRYEEKKNLFLEEKEKVGRSCVTPEQTKELNDDWAEINRLECRLKREKANQDFQKTACISNNQKTHSSEQQNVTDTSQTN